MLQGNIKELTKENENFRKVICTGNWSQVVLMSIPPGEDIGEEIHPGTDQILFIVDGEGEATLNNHTSSFKEKDFIFVPAGTRHNFKNTGDDDLKLYTVYSPPAHKGGTVHKTKNDAQKSEVEEYKRAEVVAQDIYENF